MCNSLEVYMQKAMVFIDFENFDIAKYNYYKKKSLDDAKKEAREKGEKHFYLRLNQINF